MKFQLAAFVLVVALLCSGIELSAQQTSDAADSAQVESQAKPFIGIQMKNTDDGVTVVDVVAGSPAEEAGLKANDLLVKMGGKELADRNMLMKEFVGIKVGDTVEFVVLRDGTELKVSVVVGDARVVGADSVKAEMPKTVEFESEDGLLVTVDVYAPVADDAPAIVLCHQAGWSRGEYQEIAPKLNEMGFNCYAIDQRSGGGVNDIVNETNKRAANDGKGVAFLDAEQDIVAALKLVRRARGLGKGKVILWGSSYSAALSLRIAGEHPDLVDGVLAFAPGEYFKRFGKPGDWIQASAKKIKAPAFITSAKKEHKNWKSIYEAIPGETGESKAMFVPETKGNHGSRALWEKFDDHEAYWDATSKFLSQFVEDDDSQEEHSNEEEKETAEK